MNVRFWRFIISCVSETRHRTIYFLNFDFTFFLLNLTSLVNRTVYKLFDRRSDFKLIYTEILNNFNYNYVVFVFSPCICPPAICVFIGAFSFQFQLKWIRRVLFYLILIENHTSLAESRLVFEVLYSNAFSVSSNSYFTERSYTSEIVLPVICEISHFGSIFTVKRNSEAISWSQLKPASL